MAELTVTLITGRSTRQGTGISAGKGTAEYRAAVQTIELSPADMARAGLNDGDTVRLKTGFGTAEVRCRTADVPEGLAFMAFGAACNRLVGGETYASGTPDSKNVEVQILPAEKLHEPES